MNYQMHKERVKNATKKRRNYLRTKASTTVMAVCGSAGALFFGLVGLFYLCGFVGAPGLIISPVFFFFAIKCGMAGSRSVRHRRYLRYVPPVAEQIAALPAEAILVRASDELAAVPEELLRAAQGGTVASREELLRVVPGKELSS